VGPRAWRIGGGASSAMVIRRRPRKRVLRRAGSLVRPTHTRVWSSGARGRSRHALVALELSGARSSPRGAPMAGGGARRWLGVRARQDRGLAYILTGGRLGASGVTPVTHTRVERPRHGRRCASLRRPMARHGRCADRWIGATWHGPLATCVMGRFPPSQRSDRWSLQHLGVRARRGYGMYGGVPTRPRATSRQSALRRSRAFSIR
jgi:hypothetical protein